MKIECLASEDRPSLILQPTCQPRSRVCEEERPLKRGLPL